MGLLLFDLIGMLHMHNLLGRKLLSPNCRTSRQSDISTRDPSSWYACSHTTLRFQKVKKLKLFNFFITLFDPTGSRSRIFFCSKIPRPHLAPSRSGLRLFQN